MILYDHMACLKCPLAGKFVGAMLLCSIHTIYYAGIMNQIKYIYQHHQTIFIRTVFFYEYQFGFRKNHSTSQAVVEVLDNIYQHCDSQEDTMGIYMDLQKSFDTVNHSILIKKLEIYGIRGTVLQWFISYLSNRRQYTVLSTE